MSYPTNIAPQTPSDPYDVVGIGNDPVFVELKGSVFETVIGAKSRCRVDLPFYNGSTTRDQVDASTLGRAPVSLVSYKNASGVYAGSPFTNNGDAVYVEIEGGADTFTPTADEIGTMMQQDDNFTHTAPHQNVLAYTVIRYFDGPVIGDAPSGDLVGEFTIDRWIGEGSRIPQIVGATPPIYDPNATE